MRADIERNTVAGTDPYGNPLPPAFTPLTTLPCFVWSRAERLIKDGSKTAVVEDLRAMFSLTADVLEGDEIAQVRGRGGAVIYPDRMRVDTIQHKHSHVEAMLEKVT